MNEEKLNQAIELGFITRKIDPDGIVNYGLTEKGALQWIKEKFPNFAEKMKEKV